MLYLNSTHIREIGVDWRSTIKRIYSALEVFHSGDYAQPIKPYLHFKNPENRIIAMPAYVGGEFSTSGIKWIASFPGNRKKPNLPRAHSVTILNDVNTGVPLANINSAVISGIRTASVTGVMIHEYLKVREQEQITLGILGFGPIGRMHLEMAQSLLGDKIAHIRLFDIAGIEPEFIPQYIRDKVVICKNWEEVYSVSDIFITCTVSKKGYIDKTPKSNALLLNVSLRDFKPDILEWTRSIVVDNWEEVCRADTDIEVMQKERGLKKEETVTLGEVAFEKALEKLPAEQPIMFNPMGMAVFDIAMAEYYYQQAKKLGIGVLLED